MKHIFTFILVLLITGNLQANPEPDVKVVYKKMGDIELSLHFFFPENHSTQHNTPAIVFFHGGGWNGGGVNHFYNQAAYFASQGIVGVRAQYRVKKQYRTSPKECVKDGKSALRFIKSNAGNFGVDPDTILAAGGSAGGHVAAATATLSKFNEDGENTTVSCIPKALVLFNPVANNGPDGYGFKRVKE